MPRIAAYLAHLFTVDKHLSNLVKYTCRDYMKQKNKLNFW